MYDIIELQHKLMEAQGSLPTSKIIRRTAAIEDASKLLKSEKYTTEEVSYFLGLPKSVVESEQARIERYYEDRRKFLASGRLETSGNEMAHFSILQR